MAEIMDSSLLIIDQYSLTELEARYHDANPKERIRLLKKLYSSVGTLPFEIASMAVSDSNCEVRRWMAKNADSIDYTWGESIFDDHIIPVKWNTGIVRTGSPESNGAATKNKNLRLILEKDSDMLVRALAKANGNIYDSLGSEWMGWFSESSDLERLALIRNPKVARGQDLVEKIFDPADKTLKIAQDFRKQLCWAFLFNVEGVRWAGRYYGDRLWKSLSKWNQLDAQASNRDLVYCGYRNIDPGDGVRAQVYRECPDDILRIAILEGCQEASGETVELAMADKAENCREFAHGRTFLDPERFKSIVKGGDKAALNGLAHNSNLGPDQLEEVWNRLMELGDRDGAGRARTTIERLEQAQSQSADRAEEDAESLQSGLVQLLTMTRWIFAGVALLVALRLFR